MAVTVKSGTIRYVGLSTDTKPRAGVQSDGTSILARTPIAATHELYPGDTFEEQDTGLVYRWDGSHWLLPRSDDESLLEEESPQLLSAILLELRAIRTGIELTLALDRGVHVDLTTETITQLQER